MPEAGGATRNEMSIVDVHSHPSMALYHQLAEATRGMGPAERFDYKNFFPPGMPLWTPQMALDTMERRDIRAQVLSLPDCTVELRGETARSWARRINEALAGVVADHPGRFGAFAVIPHDDADSSIAEIAYALDVLKLDGVTTTTNIRGVYLGDAQFDPWMEELHRRQAVLFVHPALPPVPDPATPPLIQFSFDSTRMAMNMVLSGAKRRFAGVKVIATHGGGTIPYTAHRLETLQPLINPKWTQQEIAEGLRSFWFDLTSAMGDATLAAISRFADPSRVIMGFDYPYAPEAYIGAEVSRFGAFDGIGAPEKAMIRSANALALFPRLANAQTG